jgi:hypothetical protein
VLEDEESTHDVGRRALASTTMTLWVASAQPLDDRIEELFVIEDRVELA